MDRRKVKSRGWRCKDAKKTDKEHHPEVVGVGKVPGSFSDVRCRRGTSNQEGPYFARVFVGRIYPHFFSKCPSARSRNTDLLPLAWTNHSACRLLSLFEIMPQEEGPQKRQRTTAIASTNGSGHDFFVLHQKLAANSSLLPATWAHATLHQASLPQLPSKELKDAIHAITQQLIQVKNRLGPASQQAADHAQTTATAAFQEARHVCNPMEVLDHHLKGRRFLNRSALKLANIDAVLDFSLISPSSLEPPQPFVFVDLCGAPGGFSEYILQRCGKMRTFACDGYGMSLVGANEHGVGLAWKLGTTEWQDGCRYTVTQGSDGTGDIYQWANVEHLHQCMQHGPAHLVVCDGGMDAQRDYNDQEGLTIKLVVCQAAAALSCLRKGGTLVMKLFGCQTSTIRSLLMELVNAFTNLQLIKPITSRPASAERYLVATGFLGLPAGWDGPTWMDAIFLGRLGLESPEVAYFLDSFDHEMLQLNLTACYAILSYLEHQVRDLENSQSILSIEEHYYEVPVHRYCRAWRL